MLSYSEMLSLLPEITRMIVGKKLIRFIQINPTSYLLEFRNAKLLLCVQKPFSRFHITTKKYKHYPSIFADKVHKFLKERTCTEIFLLAEDRILCLRFENYYFIAELMYHQPVLVVTDSLLAILLSNKPSSSPYKSPITRPCIKHHLTFVTSKIIEDRYQLLEQQALSEKCRKKIVKQLAKLERKLKHYQEEYCQAKNWRILQHETELLKSNLQQIVPGRKSVQVMDWEKQTLMEIPLDPALSIQNQLQVRFKKVRKMKKRLEIYPKFIQEVDQKITRLHQELSNPKIEVSNQTPLKHSLKKGRNKTCCFHTFIDTEYTILVGKNAKGNEKLTFTIANGNDIWLHVTPMTGSHVIIKSKTIKESVLQDAMQLTLYFSQARKQSQAEVLITEVKYVSRTKTTGKVFVSKHKTKKVQLDPDRIKELLKKRAVKNG